MQRLKVSSDMSELLEYGTPALPLRSHVTDLADFSGQATDCHWHEDLEFLLVLQGSMYYFVEDQQYLLTPGMGIFVNSGRLHYGKAVGNDGCLHSFLLTGLPLFKKHEYLEEKYIAPLIHENSVDAMLFSPRISWQKEALGYIDSAISLFRNRQEGYELLLTSLLDRLVLTLYQHLPTAEKKVAQPSGETAMKRMIGFIKKNYGEKIQLDDIAAAGAVCRSRCCQQFKAVLKMSPIEYLTHYRLEKSCELLKNPGNSVTDVAGSCGFGSSSYFGSRFRQKYGVTPREYQQQYIGK